jgi:hypothetical protein
MVRHLLIDEMSRYAVELAERSVDEPISEMELDIASGHAEGAFEDSLTDDLGANRSDDDPIPGAASAASYASCPGFLDIDDHIGVVIEGAAEGSSSGFPQKSPLQANSRREIIRNPFPPMNFDRTCITSTIPSLAQAAYADRILPSGELARDRLAVLSDALEEAGCDDSAVLDHLRGPGPHVRGCWALDLILGKA